MYLREEVDNLLLDKSDTDHHHDTLYYGKTEVANLLLSKSDTGHTHNDIYYDKDEINDFLLSIALHDHNDIYYLKTEIDTALETKQNTLTAGTNINISNNVISATGVTRHDDTTDKNSNTDFQHVTSVQKTDFGIKATRRERITLPGTTATIQLKNDTITVISNVLTNSYAITLIAPTSTENYTREFGIIIQIGTTVPLITFPSPLKWATPAYVGIRNTKRMIVFMPVTYNGTDWEYFASCDIN